jgi:hypothetical protein
MLMAIQYAPAGNVTADDRKTTRDLFIAWKPPAGVAIQAHWHFVSGGGVIIMEAEDSGPIYESLEPFRPRTTFDIEPVINMIEAVAISLNIEEWVGSVTGPEESRRRD